MAGWLLYQQAGVSVIIECTNVLSSYLCGHIIGSSALGQWGIGKNLEVRNAGDVKLLKRILKLKLELPYM